MRGFRVSLAIVVGGLCLALPGCWPPPPPPPTVDVTVNVDASCSVGADEVHVMPGDLVRFCNNNSCLVTIIFESRDLFGRNSVRLDPGGCATLRVRSGAAGHDFAMNLDCESCGEGGGHTSPEMKVGGGGP